MTAREIHDLYLGGVGCFRQVVIVAAKAINNPETIGGSVCIADLYGNPLSVMPIGEIMEEKISTNSRLSIQRAQRLGFYPDHISGWQSRNLDEGKCGGPIRCNRYILSFCGFKDEHWDEACMVAYVIYRMNLSFEMAARIEKTSGNPHIRNLLKVIGPLKID